MEERRRRLKDIANRKKKPEKEKNKAGGWVGNLKG
jgi:hypothetical protein